MKGLLRGGLWAHHVESLGQTGAVGHLSMKPVYFCVDTDIHTVPMHQTALPSADTAVWGFADVAA